MKDLPPLVGKDAPLRKLSQTFPKKIDESLALGLDLGVGSCGQALVYDSVESKSHCKIKGLPEFPGRIAFLGVRAFDVPQINGKTGVALKNPERRSKRLLRRTTRRRAWRMWEVRKLFKKHGLLPADYPVDRKLWKAHVERNQNAEVDKWRDWHSRTTAGRPGLGTAGPLELRVKALDEKLTPLEWASALLHLTKHRGFRSNRKSLSGEGEDEGGKVLKALSTNQKRMVQGAYRTVGEMLLKDPDFAERKRNREGSYTATLLRSEQENEIRRLFARQRDLRNDHAGKELEEAYIDLFNRQKPLQNSINLLGVCPFEKTEKRASRYSPSFELSRALQKLNTLSLILPTGVKVRLADLVDAPNGGYDKFIRVFATFGNDSNPGRITWKDLRKIFPIPAGASFVDLPTASRKRNKDGTDEVTTVASLEAEDFVTRSGSNAAAKGSFLLHKVVGSVMWEEFSKDRPEQLDLAVYALTFFEEIENTEKSHFYWGILNQMRSDQLDERLIQMVDADLRSDKSLLARFNGTSSMSAQACRKLIPHLRLGMVYSEACSEVYGDHRQTDFRFDAITNPIVKSVVQECVKQVVHVIDEVGSLPGRICVEIGRDLGKSIMERNEITKGIKTRTDAKNSNRESLRSELGRDPDDDQLLRYELWREQAAICPYCGNHLGKPIDVVGNEFEVDHILPRSRSFDNSYENKVIVHKRCNQNKRNATPFEFASIGNGSAESEGWRKFTAVVANLKGVRKQKRRNLLNTTFAEDEVKFASRHLNDSRSIARLVTFYLHSFYEWAGEKPITEKGSSKRVFVQPGPLTAIVRKAWGLENLKKDVQGNRLGDKHHAVDALVCALLSEGQRRFVTVREQEKQTARLDAGFLGEVGRCYRLMEDENDHRQTPRDLPLPWSDFRNSVVEALDLFTVSRRENCKGRGGLHNDTIYRVENENGKEVTFSRRPILDTNAGKPKSLFTKLSDLDKIKDIHSLENRWLKAELTRWIESGSPVEPENLPRDPQGTLIRKVTVALGSKSGRKYPQGFVSGGNQVRVDIFSKTNRRDGLIYYIVPVYSHHLIQDAAPSKAITRGKDEAHWDEVDASFHFEFSLWPNSRFRVVKPRNATKPEGEDIVGLYSGVDRNTMAISFADPEDSRVSDRVSVKTGTEKFQKLYVDRLGRETVVKSEKRTWRGKTVE